MSAETLHPHVEFARRHNDGPSSLLNAYAAIVRLEALVEDAESLSRMFDQQIPPEERWAPWFGAEAISYYAVGFVTCFEWHARSRIVDLYRFMPGAMRAEDLRGQVGDKVMAQLLGQNASVASLLGASISIGSFQKYIATIDRAFKDLSFPTTPSECLKAAEAGDEGAVLSSADFDELNRLFDFRHNLVHEIDLNVLGHANIRDTWAPDDAVRIGKLCIRTLRGIEQAFTAHAPAGFPNRLTASGYPESPLTSLEAEILRLEAVVSELTSTIEWGDQAETVRKWSSAVLLAREAYEADKGFIDDAGFLHSRYLDLKGPAQVQLAQARVSYLQGLVSIAGQIWDIADFH